MISKLRTPKGNPYFSKRVIHKEMKDWTKAELRGYYLKILKGIDSFILNLKAGFWPFASWPKFRF
jgi:hypothetical protein